MYSFQPFLFFSLDPTPIKMKIIDLDHENYNEKLVHKFYYEMLKPNFGLIEGELDPIDVW